MKQETKTEIAQIRKIKDLQVWEAEIASQKLRIFDEQRKILYATQKRGIATCGDSLWAEHDNGYERLTNHAKIAIPGDEIERRSIEIIFTDCDSYERIAPKNDRHFDDRLYFEPLTSSNYQEWSSQFEEKFGKDENFAYADYFIQIDWEFEEMRYWLVLALQHYDLREHGRFYFPKHVGIDPAKNHSHVFEWQQI
jgi:hypothetical protein